MKRAFNFAFSWIFSAAVFNVLLDGALVLFFAALSFVKLQNMFPEWAILTMLGRTTLVFSAILATSYVFSREGRRDWQ